MRVALVSPYDLDVVGGVQSHVAALAEALRATGDEVLVVGPGAARSTDAAVRAVDRADHDVRTVRVGRSWAVPANGSRAPLALTPSAARRAVAALRRFRPDVVHVHEPLVPIVGPAAALSRVAPTVLTFHAHATGGPLPVLARLARPLARAVIDRASALVAVSPLAASFHASVLGIDPARLRIVPNGVDVGRFGADRPPRDPARPPVVLLVGRLEPRKGADLALAAFARLAEARDDVRLRIVGSGPLEGDLRRRIAELPTGVAARIDLVGRVTQADLPAEIAAADVALVPSRGGESFGIVLLELMAAGTPIVASDLPAYRAVARPDLEALLVPVGDDAALTAATARMLAEPALAARLAAAGRRRAASFDWRHVAADVRDVLAAAARPPADG